MKIRCGDLALPSHFFTPFFFCFYDGTGIRIFCASSNRKASGTDAQPGYEISVLFRGLKKLHQRAKSHRYDLGTACQLEKEITFLSDMKLQMDFNESMLVLVDTDNMFIEKERNCYVELGL